MPRWITRRRRIFALEGDEAQIRYLSAGEVRQSNDVLQEIILLAARNEQTDNFVEQIHRAGVRLVSLDLEPCAIFRSVERFIRRREDEQEVYVLANIGYSCTQVIIGKGRDIGFLKTIDLGGLHCHEAVARKLGISTDEAQSLRRRLVEGAEVVPDGTAPATESPEKRDPVRQAAYDAAHSVVEQLAREISLCLRYQSVTFRGQRPMRSALVGGEAADPCIQSLLASIITIPVEAARPLCSVDTSRMKAADRRGAATEWALAMGLALRHAAGRLAPRNGKSRQAASLERAAQPPDNAEASAPREEAMQHA